MSEKETFDDYYNSYRIWIEQAASVLKASEFLKENDTAYKVLADNDNKNITSEDIKNIGKYSFSDTILMLRSFGIECYFKALYLLKGNVLYENGSMNNSFGKGHDLTIMAEKLVHYMSFTEGDYSILYTLTFYNEMGRYPGMSSMSKQKTFTGDRMWSLYEDDDSYYKLLDKLRKATKV